MTRGQGENRAGRNRPDRRRFLRGSRPVAGASIPRGGNTAGMTPDPLALCRLFRGRFQPSVNRSPSRSASSRTGWNPAVRASGWPPSSARKRSKPCGCALKGEAAPRLSLDHDRAAPRPQGPEYLAAERGPFARGTADETAAGGIDHGHVERGALGGDSGGGHARSSTRTPARAAACELRSRPRTRPSPARGRSGRPWRPARRTARGSPAPT